MAHNQAKSNTKNTWRQAQGKRQGIEKRSQTLRQSARLRQAQQNSEAKHFLPPPSITNPPNPEASHRSPPLEPETVTPSSSYPEPKTNQKPERKRKQSQEVECSQGPSEKRPRTDINGNRLPADININGNPSPTDINGSRPLADINGNRSRRVAAWLQQGSYPEDYLDPGDQTWEDIKANASAGRLESDGMKDLRLARKKSAASFRQVASEENTDVVTENTGDKSLPYRSPGYAAELADQGSYLCEAPEGITDKGKELCQKLLTTKQTVPQDSDFHDDRFKEVCDMVRYRNEARVVEDISPLIAPSPEKLKIYGAKELEHLVFNTNERWSESIAVTKTRPQPDGSVGFKRSAFTENQIQKLLPYIGDRVPINFVSLFLATWRTFFPFFTREAKGGEGDLDVADKQNAHSMTIAVRGIVELFKLVHRERELHREILAFSISHDASIVKIYGHYALTTEKELTFWRHHIRTLDFTEQDGKEKWTAYQFTKNVYFEFMPELHKRICSAIDRLPLKTAASRLISNPRQQIPLDASVGTDTNPDSEQPDSQGPAFSAPGSQNRVSPKKRKLTANAMLERQLDRKEEAIERVRQESEEKLERVRQQSNEKLEQVRQQSNEKLERAKQESDEKLERAKQESDEKLRQELERQRQESERQRQESERQRQESERQQQEMRAEISKLTDTISALASQTQKARKE